MYVFFFDFLINLSINILFSDRQKNQIYLFYMIHLMHIFIEILLMKELYELILILIYVAMELILIQKYHTLI